MKEPMYEIRGTQDQSETAINEKHLLNSSIKGGGDNYQEVYTSIDNHQMGQSKDLINNDCSYAMVYKYQGNILESSEYNIESTAQVEIPDQDSNETSDTQQQSKDDGQNKKFIHIQNGVCQIVSARNESFKTKQEFLNLNEFFLRMQRVHLFKINKARCCYDQKNKIFVLYDDLSAQFCIFDLQNEQFHQISFSLEQTQLFCLNWDDLALFITRVEKNIQIIEEFSINLENKSIEPITKNERLELDNIKITHVYYQDNQLNYFYKRIPSYFEELQDESEDGSESFEVIKCSEENFEEMDLKYVVTDLFNNSLAITSNNQLLYNFTSISSVQSVDDVPEVAKYFSDKCNQSGIVYFHSKPKYRNQQLTIKYDDSNKFDQKSQWKLVY